MNRRWIVSCGLLCVLGVVVSAGMSYPIPTQAQAPFFSMALGADDDTPNRVWWTEIIADAWRRLNIDATPYFGPWSYWIPRVLEPTSDSIGKPHAEGGYDVFFLGGRLSRITDPTSFFHSDAMVPAGYNYPLWNDSVNDALIDAIITEPNVTARNLLLFQWQQHFQEESPKAILFYPKEAWAYTPSMRNFESFPYTFPNTGDPGIRMDTPTLKIGTNFIPFDFNPILAGTDKWSSHQDRLAINPCFDALYYYNSSTDFFNFVRTPCLTTQDYEVSSDGRNWTIHLRDDVYWPTGFRFNASDLAMTYHACLIPAFQDRNSGEVRHYDEFVETGLTNESIVVVDEFTVTVTFPTPYAWAASLLNIQPLSWVAMKDIPWTSWTTHGSNTGIQWTTTDINGEPYAVFGCLGVGPYVVHDIGSGWNATMGTFRADLRDPMGSKGALANGTIISYHNGVRGFGSEPMPAIYEVQQFFSLDAAIDALESGQVDLIDSQFMIQSKLGLIDPAWGKILVGMALKLQEVGFNMQHPIFGTGEATPNGQADPANAALYAKYVRQALNYMIPRGQIIEQRLTGFAELGVTFVSPLTSAYSPAIHQYMYNEAAAWECMELAGYVRPPGCPYYPCPEAIILLLGVVVIIQVGLLAVLLWRNYSRQVQK
ncbi:MAG: ABC transporter substrate-binding protein [Candidatus Hodarchaeota archaeon]